MKYPNVAVYESSITKDRFAVLGHSDCHDTTERMVQYKNLKTGQVLTRTVKDFYYNPTNADKKHGELRFEMVALGYQRMAIALETDKR